MEILIGTFAILFLIPGYFIYVLLFKKDIERRNKEKLDRSMHRYQELKASYEQEEYANKMLMSLMLSRSYDAVMEIIGDNIRKVCDSPEMVFGKIKIIWGSNSIPYQTIMNLVLSKKFGVLSGYTLDHGFYLGSNNPDYYLSLCKEIENNMREHGSSCKFYLLEPEDGGFFKGTMYVDYLCTPGVKYKRMWNEEGEDEYFKW